MRKLSGGAMLLLGSMALTGCISTSVHVSKEGIKTTSVAVRGCGNPSQTITRVETPGKQDITFGSAGPDLCNTITNASIGALGQMGAAHLLPESHINVSSGSVNENNTDVRIER